ncbi:MAG: hypothetical protein EZS28_018089 [Streblomastix strix]|uniref:Uncharacterized protein n=1 Tax=Streblomastix strix TaxID=222440 RepID=A0A5J4VUK3_9EUKA|nr:MAG: hypothetical protein EZS28_018089 [Streblomastix strix]
MRFSVDDLDLRSGDSKLKYRFIINNIPEDDFRKNFQAASEILASKPEKRSHAQQDIEMNLDANIKLDPNLYQLEPIYLNGTLNKRLIRRVHRNIIKIRQK